MSHELTSVLTCHPPRAVAYKRITDNVPLAVDYELTQGMSRGLLSVLNSELGIYRPNAYNICADMAKESVHIADRRKELEDKLKRLGKASEEFDDEMTRSRYFQSASYS
jgi:hypothetical protein